MDSAREVTEHLLTVPRSARYYQSGDPAAAANAWIGLHGYGQLAGAFLGYLATAARPDRLLVAPEALSRFYHDNGHGPIGASWMTREDRDREIADYVHYLDAVRAEVAARLPRDHRVFVLGFSQGVATLTRWLTRGTTRVAGAILWAGNVAVEVDAAALRPALGGKRLAIVAGSKDEYVKPEWFEQEKERFAKAGAECRDFTFHGGHRLDRVVLAQAMEFVEGG
jgi:predicted esterase